MKNIEIKGLEDGDYEKYSIHKLGCIDGGKVAGNLTLETKVGIHIEDEELRREWATLGGHATIDNLLQWQKDNDHNIGDFAKVKDDEWKSKISESLTGRKLSKQHIENTKKGLKKYVKSLSNKQRSEKYSNDSASRKSLMMRTEILNLIETDTFITSDARRACLQYGLDNWKGFLKDKRIIKQIYKGTNQNNPSIYQKIK